MPRANTQPKASTPKTEVKAPARKTNTRTTKTDKAVVITTEKKGSKTLGFVSIEPTTKVLMSLRHSGQNPYAAVADMVDNSMEPQVGAKNIYVTVDASKHIIIADDGLGMTYDQLWNAMRLGSESDPKAPKKILGGFGMGMKTAGSSMGTVITVITRQRHHEVVTAVYDIEQMRRTNKIAMALNKASKVEHELFTRYTKGASTGTVVMVSKLDLIKNKNTGSFVGALRRRLSEIFRLYVQDSEITLDGVTSVIPATNLFLNNVAITPSDIMMESQDSRLMYDDTHLINYLKEGVKAKAAVRFKLFLLPDIKSQSDDETDDVRLSASNQGLYVMRNNRQIVRATMLDIFQRDPNNNRFRGEIYVDGDLDQALGLNYQKNDIASREDSVQEQLKNIIRPQFMHIREIINQERGKSNAEDEQLQEDTQKILKEINAKAKELGLTGKAKRDPRDIEDEKILKEIQKRVKKEQDPKTPKGENPPKSALEIKYMPLGVEGNIVEYTHKDNSGLLMTWNTEHKFFDKFLNKAAYDVKRAMNILYLSAGLEQGRVLLKGSTSDGLEPLVSEYNQQIAKAVALLM